MTLLLDKAPELTRGRFFSAENPVMGIVHSTNNRLETYVKTGSHADFITWIIVIVGAGLRDCMQPAGMVAQNNKAACMTDFSESGERISDREPSYGRSTGLVLGQLTGNKGPAPGIVACRRASHDRRRRRVSAFLYGNFRPRRRQARRADDHHVWFDWHEPRVLYLALGVLLLSCADALFTLNLLVLGAEEANSVMNVLLGRSIDLFLAVKISLTAFAVIVLVAAAHRPFLGLFRVVRLLQLALAGYIVLIAYELWMFTAVFGVSLGALGFGASLPPG